MEPQNIREYLKRRSIFFSRLGFCYDPPIYGEDGKLVLLAPDFNKYIGFHRDMHNAGVKIHTCIVHSGWVGVDKYDYSIADETFKAIFSVADDVLFIPRVKLNVPVEWCGAYPEDVFVYENGPSTVEGIRELVGTLKQDYLGYDSKDGYYQAGEYVDPRPNVGGLISLQSLSSEKWLEDASVALEKFIERYERLYGDKILAYHIAFGPCGEDMNWGRLSRRYGDFGINARKNFYKYGLKKYGDSQKLIEKWGACVDGENVAIPSQKVRYQPNGGIVDFFRGDKKDIISIDYDEFLSDSVAEAIDRFGGIVKEKCGKATGFFYGYFVYMINSAYGGHLAIDKVLKSKNVDFLCAPTSYYRRLAGDTSGEMCPPQSINLEKLWIEEIDCRTNLARAALDKKEKMYADTFNETFCVFWRNVCKNLAQGAGYWWMDLGGGWFDAPEIHSEIKKISAFSEIVNQKSGESIADVLVLVDEKSMYKMKEDNYIAPAYMLDFICETRSAGIASDVYRLADIDKLDLTRYKLVILAYDFVLNNEIMNKITSSGVKSVAFNYCSGIWNEGDCSLENVEKLTGFVLEESEWEYSFPALSVKGTSERFAEREENGIKYFINLQPYLKAEKIREMAKIAGCHIYADFDCVLYGDNRFLGVFPRDLRSGEIDLGKTLKFADALTGKSYCSDKIHVEFSKKSDFAVYVIENR